MFIKQVNHVDLFIRFYQNEKKLNINSFDFNYEKINLNIKLKTSKAIASQIIIIQS